MKLIALGGTDRKAFVDDEDYPIISRYAWHLDVKGYAVTSFANTTVRMHRMILNPPKKFQVDHINMDKLDNQKDNLRLCTNSLNQANTKKRTKVSNRVTSSKYKGVHLRKDNGKWSARIGYHGKRIHIGLFETQEEAAKAYNEAAFKYFGEYAKLNQIEGE